MIIQGRQCDERIQFIYFIYKVLVVLRRVDQNSRLKQNGPVQNLNISVTNFFSGCLSEIELFAYFNGRLLWPMAYLSLAYDLLANVKIIRC